MESEYLRIREKWFVNLKTEEADFSNISYDVFPFLHESDLDTILSYVENSEDRQLLTSIWYGRRNKRLKEGWS